MRKVVPSLHKNEGAFPSWHLEALAAWIPFGLLIWALVDRIDARASEREAELRVADTTEPPANHGPPIAMMALRGQHLQGSRSRQTFAEWICM
jgi:hypothetical protein